jgi:hypothetical protein
MWWPTDAELSKDYKSSSTMALLCLGVLVFVVSLTRIAKRVISAVRYRNNSRNFGFTKTGRKALIRRPVSAGSAIFVFVEPCNISGRFVRCFFWELHPTIDRAPECSLYTLITSLVRPLILGWCRASLLRWPVGILYDGTHSL